MTVTPMNWWTNIGLWCRAHAVQLWPAAAIAAGFTLMAASPARPVYSMIAGFLLVVFAAIAVQSWRWLRPRIGGWTATFALSVVCGMAFAGLLALTPDCPLVDGRGRCELSSVAAGGLSTTMLVWVVVALVGPMLVLPKVARAVVSRVRRRRPA